MRRSMRGWSGCCCVVLLLLFPPALTHAAPGDGCFAETGSCIQGRFLDYWLANGGLARNGYPLTPERREVLEDGQEYTVQYFERIRMELHPENAPPYDVLLGQFGREVFRESFGSAGDRYDAALRPTAPKPGLAFFPGHSVAPDFFAYWQANGGLAQFGYPLAEEQDRPDGASPPLRVQYFERGRLEEHPENAPPYDILLGQFGRQVLAWRDTPIGAPFAALYRGDPTLRELLGPPGVGIATSNVEVLSFERGLTIVSPPSEQSLGSYGVFMLCGAAERGYVPTNARTGLPGLAVRPEPGEQLPAGGPGPRPNTYAPGSVVGLLWERGLFRDCLGYATVAAPTTQIVTVQTFSRGRMIALPERGEVYALYVRAGGDSPTGGYYRRYALPR